MTLSRIKLTCSSPVSTIHKAKRPSHTGGKDMLEMVVEDGHSLLMVPFTVSGQTVKEGRLLIRVQFNMK